MNLRVIQKVILLLSRMIIRLIGDDCLSRLKQSSGIPQELANVCCFQPIFQTLGCKKPDSL